VDDSSPADAGTPAATEPEAPPSTATPTPTPTQTPEPEPEINSAAFTIDGFSGLEITVANPSNYKYTHSPAVDDPVLPAREGEQFSICINEDSTVTFSKDMTGSYFDASEFAIADVTFAANTTYTSSDFDNAMSFSGDTGDLVVMLFLSNYDAYIASLENSKISPLYDICEEYPLVSGKLGGAADAPR
jgi:hypothetical protein